MALVRLKYERITRFIVFFARVPLWSFPPSNFVQRYYQNTDDVVRQRTQLEYLWNNSSELY